MSCVVKAANDNELGRTVVVHMSEPTDDQISLLAEIFCGVLDGNLLAANDNEAAQTQRGF